MARTRSIKPGFFTNEVLGALPYQDRLLFAGLWTIADREGRLEDRPLRIRGELFPYDHEIDIEACLLRLEHHRFIHRYITGDSRYIQVNNFAKHQSPHHTEKVSVIEAPLINGALTVNIPPSTLIPSTLNNLPPSSQAAPNPARLPKGYAFDEQYKTFREACENFGMAVIEEDFMNGEKGAWLSWCALDGLQRQAAIQGILDRQEAGANPQMVPRPKRYLDEREWKRKPIPANGSGRRETLSEQMLREAEERERV